MEMNSQIHVPVTLTPGSGTQDPLDRSLGGLQSWSERTDEKNSPPMPRVEIRVRFPADAVKFYRHHVQTGPGAHSASYPVDVAGSLPWDKVAGAWIWPLNSI
jgi:hypothetical protein